MQDTQGPATVDRKCRPDDMARRFGSKKHNWSLEVVLATSAAKRRHLHDFPGAIRKSGREPCRKIAWAKGIDVNVMLAPLGGQSLRERDQRAFARVVGDRKNLAVRSGAAEPRNGRNVYDLARFVRNHRALRHLARNKETCIHIQAHHLAPCLLGVRNGCAPPNRSTLAE